MKLSLPPHVVKYPDWLLGVLPDVDSSYGKEALMGLAHAIALANVSQGGGPFGAIVATEEGKWVSLGANRVVADVDSTAHAEIMAIRNAEKECGTHYLSAEGLPPLELYTSCAPCIQCYGAIWWSGLKTVYSSASKEDAERVGFSEGPVTPELWQALESERGVKYHAGFARDAAALRPFELFAKAGELY